MTRVRWTLAGLLLLGLTVAGCTLPEEPSQDRPAGQDPASATTAKGGSARKAGTGPAERQGHRQRQHQAVHQRGRLGPAVVVHVRR